MLKLIKNYLIWGSYILFLGLNIGLSLYFILTLSSNCPHPIGRFCNQTGSNTFNIYQLYSDGPPSLCGNGTCNILNCSLVNNTSCLEVNSTLCSNLCVNGKRLNFAMIFIIITIFVLVGGIGVCCSDERSRENNYLPLN